MPTTTGKKGGQLGTIFGIEAGDIRIPYVYLVRSGTKNAKTPDNQRVAVGKLFHSVKKEAYDSLDVLVAHASKGIAIDNKRDNNGNDVLDHEGNSVKTQSPCYRAIMLPVDTPSQPFMTTFKGYNLFTSWKNFISELASTGRTNLDVVVRMSSKEQDTNYGYTQVLNLEIIREATEEERNLMLDASHSFGAVTAKAGDDEDEVEITVNATATVDDSLDFLNDTKFSTAGTSIDSAIEDNPTLDDILKSA